MLQVGSSASGEAFPLADPERALAVAYAPASARPALGALFALDERLGAIVAATAEPTIGLIRLAWWREALERLDSAPPPAEPLLAALAAHCLPLGITGASLAGIEDGWAALLDGEMDEAAIARHGRGRGGTMFGVAAAILSHRRAGPGFDEETVGRAGEAWALADLGHRHSNQTSRLEARRQAALAPLPDRRWPAPLRPLGALTALAKSDATADTRAQGSPGRLLRMLALKLTGL